MIADDAVALPRKLHAERCLLRLLAALAEIKSLNGICEREELLRSHLRAIVFVPLHGDEPTPDRALEVGSLIEFIHVREEARHAGGGLGRMIHPVFVQSVVSKNCRCQGSGRTQRMQRFKEIAALSLLAEIRDLATHRCTNTGRQL